MSVGRCGRLTSLSDSKSSPRVSRGNTTEPISVANTGKVSDTLRGSGTVISHSLFAAFRANSGRASFSHLSDGAQSAAAMLIPVGAAEEIAEAVTRLMSPASAFATGTMLTVSGGR